MRKSIIIFLTFITAGCARYHALPLVDLPVREKSGLLVIAKAFSKSDSLRYLDRDVISKGYQPIQLYFKNETERSYLFSLDQVSLPYVDPIEVADVAHSWTVARMAGYGAVALIGSPLFLIPAVVDGFQSTRSNRKLDQDFITKAAHDQKIEPHAHVNMILFVPRKFYREPFSLILIDEETQRPIKITPQLY